MGWAYGIDLRQRVVDAIEGGMTHRDAAERFCVAVSTAGNWHRLWRATGSARPGKQGQPSGSKLDAYETPILEMVDGQPDIALHEVAERLKVEYGVCVATSTVCLFFQKRGITYKKRRRTPANNNARTYLSAANSGLMDKSILSQKS
jgi:transposase